MAQERWKPIEGAPQYLISDRGRLASTVRGWPVYLSPSANRDGYYAYPVPINGRRVNQRIHRLVADAFLPPAPGPKYQVNHRDGNKANNAARNLQWVTRAQNQRHRFDVLGKGNARGEQSGRATITEAQAREILARAQAGESTKIIAASVGVDYAAAYGVATRRTWRHLPTPA